MTTKAAIYVRLSRDTDESTSPVRQLGACRKLLVDRGWEEAGVYEDVDVSAYKRGLDRPGLTEARAHFTEVDALIFFRLDRLARSVVDFSRLADEAEAKGVALVSVMEGLDLGTPMGRAMAEILAIFARMESQATSVRVANAQRHLAEVGRWRGGQRPWGYRPVKAPGGGHHLEVVQEEADLIREVVERFLAGETLHSLAEDLNRRGLTTPQGNHFVYGPLRHSLERPGLAGLAVSRGNVLRDETGAPLRPYPPILDDDTWLRLQVALEERRGRSHGPRRVVGEVYLQGVVRCGSCGSTMVLNTSARPDGALRTQYRCGTVPLSACPTKGQWAAAPRVDAEVVRRLLEAFGGMPVSRLLTVTPEDPWAEERDRYLKAMADLEEDRYVRGMFQGRESRWMDLMAAVETRLASLPPPPQAHGLREGDGGKLASLWGILSEGERRMVLRSAVAEVLVHKPLGHRHGSTAFDPDRVSVTWA